MQSIKKGLISITKAKIKVERILPHGFSFKKTYPIEDGKVIIKRGGLGRGDLRYEPPFREDRVTKEKYLLILERKKVYYQDGADELMPIVPGGDPPEYTAKYVLDAADKKIMEKQAKTAGQSTNLDLLQTIFQVLIMFSLFLIMLNLGVISVG